MFGGISIYEQWIRNKTFNFEVISRSDEKFLGKACGVRYDVVAMEANNSVSQQYGEFLLFFAIS